MKQEIKAQCLLEGEEARLWQLLRNKRHFLESALRLVYKDEAIKDFFFKEVTVTEPIQRKPSVAISTAIKKPQIQVAPLDSTTEVETEPEPVADTEGQDDSAIDW
ncbi:MAG: hypothetical protein WCW84_13900 [Sulfurimonas sp.]|jgi:hypothetical protein